jgi:GxxExxY protein
MEVHRVLGVGFSEIVYKDTLDIEAKNNKIPLSREINFAIEYKSVKLRHEFFADFVMFENIIGEIKTNPKGIADEYITQTLNYLKASGSSVGLIINFGKKSLEHKRLLF